MRLIAHSFGFGLALTLIGAASQDVLQPTPPAASPAGFHGALAQAETSRTSDQTWSFSLLASAMELTEATTPSTALPSRIDLRVPFRSQKDGDRFQGSNCGPAALGMVLDSVGIERSNAELRFLTHTYQGTVGFRGGTALEHMASVAEDFGVRTVRLYDDDHFHRWSVDEVRAAVLAGQAVIPLVKYRMLPGHQDSGVRFDHYLVIYGMEEDSFLYHDPAYAQADEGAARWIEADELDRAMAAASVTRQAVGLATRGLQT